MITSALCVRSQATAMHDMMSNSVDNSSVNHCCDVRAEAISTALKAEQRCENATVARQDQIDNANYLTARRDVKNLELARSLRAKRELLMSEREALWLVLESKHITVEELNARRDRVKPLEAKVACVREVAGRCKALKLELIEGQH